MNAKQKGERVGQK